MTDEYLESVAKLLNVRLMQRDGIPTEKIKDVLTTLRDVMQLEISTLQKQLEEANRIIEMYKDQNQNQGG